MAFTFSVNNAHSPQQSLYELKQRLKTAGWTVKGSGDGTGGSFSATGDILTTYSTTTDGVAGAVTNRRAWWRLQDPAGTRELLFQHSAFNTATDLVSLSYSRSAKFTGTGDGAVAANVAPTATDAWLVMGERRPSLNMNGNAISGTATITRVDYIIGDVSEGYSFAMFLRTATGDIRGGLIYEMVVNPDASDADPYVLWSPGCQVNPWTNTMMTMGNGGGWSYGDAGVSGVATIAQANFGAWGRPAHSAPRTDAAQRHTILRPGYYNAGDNVLMPGGSNPFDSNIDIIEPAYWFSSAITPTTGTPPFGNPAMIGLVKGESRFIKGISTNAGFSNMDTNTALTRVAQAAGFWLLWDGSTTPLN